MLAAAAIAAALAAAGCGGDDEEPATTAAETAETEATGTEAAESEPTGEKAEFIAAADEICAEAAVDERAQLSEQFPDTSPEEFTNADVSAIVRDILIPSLENQVERIEELSPPEGEEEQVEEITAALRRGIDELKADPNAVREGGSLPELAEASRMATAYGFEQCGV